MSTFSPEIKALMRGGAQGLRDYFNRKNKNRQVGNWLCSKTKFYPAKKMVSVAA